jgi:hypothetical protein
MQETVPRKVSYAKFAGVLAAAERHVEVDQI